MIRLMPLRLATAPARIQDKRSLDSPRNQCKNRKPTSVHSDLVNSHHTFLRTPWLSTLRLGICRLERLWQMMTQAPPMAQKEEGQRTAASEAAPAAASGRI